jgi:hypothetical protein
MDDPPLEGLTMLYGPAMPCLDPDRPLTRSELDDERWERRRARVLTRAHVERLEAALRWALEQTEDDLCPDHQAALADAWAMLDDA